MKFDDIWNGYFQRLSVYCKKSFGLSEEDTEDMVQEILLKVYKNRAAYSKKYSVSTWIYTVARNTCIDFLRKKQGPGFAGLEEEKILQFPDRNTPRPEETAADNELRSFIADFIDGLPRDDRELVYLKMYEDLPYREISVITGLPAGTAKYRIHSIRKQLQRFLGEAYEKKSVYN
jgi:RNA polymerase sigma-70 factor, ECF subfamily